MTTEFTDTKSIQERVSAICNDLYTKGTRPTVRLVLSMLPDVSSTSTVHKYFAEWKKELEANSQSLYDRLGFSSEFTQSFMKEITRFGVEAEQRYKEQALDANEQRDIALEELGHSEEKAHKQAALVEQQSKEIKELQAELLAVKRNMDAELEKERKASGATVKELRQQLSEGAESNATLLHQNETLRTEIAKAQLKLEGNEQYVDEVKSQNTSILKSNKELSSELAQLNAKLAGQAATLTGVERFSNQMEASNEKLESANKKLEKKSTELTTERDILKKEITGLTMKLNETVSAANHLQTMVTEQSQVIAAFNKKDEGHMK